MKVLVRADSSVDLGIGHVMRCMSLAEELREEGALVTFLSRTLPGDMTEEVEQAGFRVLRLAPPSEASVSAAPELTDAEEALALLEANGILAVDWLLVDHYRLDVQWERAMRPVARQIMVIDDLADRSHDCDLLLDQNLILEADARYKGLVPDHARTLIGPRFALLRREFRGCTPNPRRRSGKVERLLISYGGTDPSNQTAKALDAVTRLEPTAASATLGVDVVIGTTNPHGESIRRQCERMYGVELHVGTTKMAELMERADLALGAPGSSSWERCVLGLPAILTALAENQEPVARGLSQCGAAWYLGPGHQVTAADLTRAMERALYDPALIATMSRQAHALVDPQPRSRVAQALLKPKP